MLLASPQQDETLERRRVRRLVCGMTAAGSLLVLLSFSYSTVLRVAAVLVGLALLVSAALIRR